MAQALLLNTLLIAITVIIHYEIILRTSLVISKMTIRHRFRIVFGVFAGLIAHSVEVWIFALGFYFMHHADGWGELTGNFDGSLLDCVYFSFTTYTTLGFGDIQPRGNLRFLTGVESLTGLVLITWTASFLFIEMQSHWNKK